MATSKSKTYPDETANGPQSSSEPTPLESSSRSRGQVSKTMTTTETTITTTTTKTTTEEAAARMRETFGGEPRAAKGLSVARVEELGKQAAIDSNSRVIRENLARENKLRGATLSSSNRQQAHAGSHQVKLAGRPIEVDGNDRVTTISTIAAQSGQSRIVLALLKDGTDLQLKVQEMRPALFEVGSDLGECSRYLEEHHRLVRSLQKQQQTPIEAWLAKYHHIKSVDEPKMTPERRLVYMCMVENLQGCWKALLAQLEARGSLLREVCDFYESVEQLAQALAKADKHVQVFREEFFAGPGSLRFNQASNELRLLNDLALDRYEQAKVKQQQLIDSIRVLGTGNLGDARVNLLIAGAKELINFISNHLDPLNGRRIKLESLMDTTTRTTNFYGQNGGNHKSVSRFDGNASSEQNDSTGSGPKSTPTGFLREINNFNDLNLVDSWLSAKIEQLNSSRLSSLGLNCSDSRSILDKHEQIALECRAIEEASLTFDGKNIHAIKSLDTGSGGGGRPKRADASLFERQKLLAQRARNVITILEARIVLLRRAIDFYSRFKEATIDVNRMLRRLQVDNSLQSVQFVSNELELKDVSSVVASGATIVNELQQLQLAQQHGQRSRLVNLSLETSGIRSVIDQLSQELAHLKTMLGQRRLVLMNEDATKMATNFSSKCRQLQFWLNSHVKSFLLAENRVDCANLDRVREICDHHEQLRVAVQNKTLEVEALLRSLPTFSENFDAKSSALLDRIQQETDELRHNWIQATNCLDRRLDLLRKYAAILGIVGVLNRELEALEGFASGRPTTPDRTDADIKSNIEQTFVQLTNQVKNFTSDARKLATAIDEHPQPVEANSTTPPPPPATTSTDINKQQMVDQVNELLAHLGDRKRAALDDAGPNASRTLNRNEEPPAHQRPQQVDPPRFTRHLADQVAEPFSSVELECETDQPHCRVEWFMNNFKRIPQNIRHSTSSEANQHKLTIHNFSPVCCGTYQARALNGSGQAVSQCRLRLAGIKEAQDEPGAGQANPSASLWRQQVESTTIQQQGASNQTSASPAISTTSSFSQWRPSEPTAKLATGEPAAKSTATTQNETMSRIIQGVGQSQQSESPVIKITQLANDSSDASETTGFPAGGRQATQQQTTTTTSNNSSRQYNASHYVESPVSSATLTRSMSKSPFGVSPQPGGYASTTTLVDGSSPRSCSRASLVCMVVGNPPPTIEWLHNNQTVTTATCPRAGQPANGSICKLTIETSNPRTQVSSHSSFVNGPQIKSARLSHA